VFGSILFAPVDSMAVSVGFDTLDDDHMSAGEINCSRADFPQRTSAQLVGMAAPVFTCRRGAVP
jgi:hypothetical protein